MTKNANICFLVSSLLLVSVAGCADEPTFGDKMILRSGNAAELGEQWNEGKDLIAEGREEKKEGRDLIKEGNQKIEDGEDLIQKGKQMQQESESLYQQRFPNNINK